MKKPNIQIILFFIMTQLGIFSFVSASEIKEIKVEAGINRIQISWPVLNLSETESVLLIKKEGICPKAYRDGQEIYRGNGSGFEDVKIDTGKKYCYAAFVYDFSGRVSEPRETGLVGKMSVSEYLANIFISKNNLFIILEVLVFLILVGVNLRKRGFFEKKSKFKILETKDR